MADWHVEVFFDGDCPLCMREIGMLRALDRERGRIRCSDITAEDFDHAALGKTQSDFMARIHGRTSDGRWIEGVEVFIELYTAVGFGSVARLARLPVLRPALDAVYGVFAKNRLQLTGRKCEEGVCEVPATPRAHGTMH